MGGAWPRIVVTSDVSLDAFQSFTTDATKTGFYRSVPDLGRLIETP